MTKGEWSYGDPPNHALQWAKGEIGSGNYGPKRSRMSYSLSFAPEFFLAEGEPYDRSGFALNRRGKPVSVWSAIEYWKEHHPEDWVTMAKEVFGLEAKQAGLLMGEAVFEKIQETNTCSDICSPVEVWIDPKGDYRVTVWE